MTILLLCTLAASACAETRSYTYGGSGHDILYDAAVSADGRIVLTGTTDSADGTLSERTKAARSGWALCIDTNGNVLWNYTTRRGSYDTLRYPVFLGNGDVAMLLETSHHGLYEVQWILLNEQGDEVARWTLESRGVPWLVRAWGVLDAYQSGYVIRCMSKKPAKRSISSIIFMPTQTKNLSVKPNRQRSHTSPLLSCPTAHASLSQTAMGNTRMRR